MDKNMALSKKDFMSKKDLILALNQTNIKLTDLTHSYNVLKQELAAANNSAEKAWLSRSEAVKEMDTAHRKTQEKYENAIKVLDRNHNELKRDWVAEIARMVLTAERDTALSILKTLVDSLTRSPKGE